MLGRCGATVHRATVAAVVIAFNFAAAEAGARGTLDQSTMPPGGYLSPVGDTNNGRSAQAHTFVAGASGFLDTVTVAVTPQSSADGRYRLRVQGTTAQGTPNGTVLAQAIIDACRAPGRRSLRPQRRQHQRHRRPASSVTTLQSSANPATLGDALIWLIDVSAVALSLSIPTGTVDLTVDGIPRGTFTLNDLGASTSVSPTSRRARTQ